MLQKFRHGGFVQQDIGQADMRHFDFTFHIKIGQRRNFVADDHRPFAQGDFKGGGAAGYQNNICGSADGIGLFVGDGNGNGGKFGLRQNFTDAPASSGGGGGKQELRLRIAFEQQ